MNEDADAAALSHHDREMIERHIEYEIAGARAAIDQLMRAMTYWQERLAAGDAVAADEWSTEAERQFTLVERQFKAAICTTRTVSAWKRQAAAGPLWVDSTGCLRIGPKPN